MEILKVAQSTIGESEAVKRILQSQYYIGNTEYGKET